MIQPEKQRLRKQCGQRLRAWPLSQKERASVEIMSSLEKLPQWNSAPRIFGFWPLADEPDLRPLLLRQPKLFLPRIAGDRLIFHRYTGQDKMQKSRHGTLEPIESEQSEVPAKEDLLLVPGVAFTAKGERLGRGGGFYDRFLSILDPDIEKAGVCFSCQILPQIPRESHDLCVDFVICDRTIKISSREERC